MCTEKNKTHIVYSLKCSTQCPTHRNNKAVSLNIPTTTRSLSNIFDIISMKSKRHDSIALLIYAFKQNHQKIKQHQSRAWWLELMKFCPEVGSKIRKQNHNMVCCVKWPWGVLTIQNKFRELGLRREMYWCIKWAEITEGHWSEIRTTTEERLRGRCK